MRNASDKGKAIHHTKAKKMIRAFQRSKHFIKIKGVFFGKKIVMKLLKQPNCVGVRCCYALNAKKERTLVLVGEHRNGKLLENLYIDDGPVCPPWCDPPDGNPG